MSDIYYRIYKDRNNRWKVIDMQYFDEYGCPGDIFYNDIRYETEEEAESIVKILNKKD